MTKLIAVRIKEENARKLYELAAREHRNPGQQLDVILDALPLATSSPAVAKGASGAKQ